MDNEGRIMRDEGTGKGKRINEGRGDQGDEEQEERGTKGALRCTGG